MFIGHRDTPESLKNVLLDVIERYVTEFQVDEFFVGHYGNFDRLAAAAVRCVRERYPQIQLIELTPYYSASPHNSLWEGIDGTFYPPGMENVPKRVAIVRANRYMVEHCDYLIAYAKVPGNAKSLVDYARIRTGIHVENIAIQI